MSKREYGTCSGGKDKLSLMFDDEVAITEFYIPEFSISTFVADLGGSLGLWLGVGAVQIFGSVVDIITWIKGQKNQLNDMLVNKHSE